MDTRNITLSLPAKLLKQARVYAAQHDTTINGLVKELLTERMARQNRVKAAINEILEIVDRGPYFTIDPGSIRREEIYERR